LVPDLGFQAWDVIGSIHPPVTTEQDEIEVEVAELSPKAVITDLMHTREDMRRNK
jgi:hypothetical protein